MLGLAACLAVVSGCASGAPAGASAQHRSSSSAPSSGPTAGPTAAVAAAPAADSNEAPAARSRPARPGVPVQVSIPALRLATRVVPVSSVDGTLEPPSDPTLLGWWQEGARPRDPGAALITGHKVHTGGGVFDHLDALQAGDKVSVRTKHGEIGYQVTRVAIYRKEKLARLAPRLFAQHGRSRLVLIGCDDWNGTTYLSNVVVVAVPG